MEGILRITTVKFPRSILCSPQEESVHHEGLRPVSACLLPVFYVLANLMGETPMHLDSDAG
jgi:hypothetical protein